MRLSEIIRGEEVIAKGNGEEGHHQLHPLTRDAAALLLDQPELGRDAGPGETGDPTAPQVGQRFYYLEIPGKRPLMVVTPGGRAHVRRRSRSRIIFHFPKNEIIARLFLSEIRAQQIAVKLRQHAHMGTVAERLRRFIDRGADGVTLVITLENPPGFRQLGEALKGKGISLATLKLPEGEPTVKLRVYPGRKRG